MMLIRWFLTKITILTVRICHLTTLYCVRVAAKHGVCCQLGHIPDIPSWCWCVKQCCCVWIHRSAVLKSIFSSFCCHDNWTGVNRVNSCCCSVRFHPAVCWSCLDEMETDDESVNLPHMNTWYEQKCPISTRFDLRLTFIHKKKNNLTLCFVDQEWGKLLWKLNQHTVWEVGKLLPKSVGTVKMWIWTHAQRTSQRQQRKCVYNQAWLLFESLSGNYIFFNTQTFLKGPVKIINMSD